MVHRGVRRREATHVRRRKYRSRQTIASSLSVASRSVVNRKKQRLVKVATFNVRMLRTYFRALELKKLAADLKVNVLVIQEHRRSTSDVDFQRNLPKGWQILIGAPSSPGVGGIDFLLSSRCSSWLLDYKFVIDVGRILQVYSSIQFKITPVRQLGMATTQFEYYNRCYCCR